MVALTYLITSLPRLILGSTRSLPRAHFRQTNRNKSFAKQQAGSHAKSQKKDCCANTGLCATWLDLARPPLGLDLCSAFARPPLDLARPRRAQKSDKNKNTTKHRIYRAFFAEKRLSLLKRPGLEPITQVDNLHTLLRPSRHCCNRHRDVRSRLRSQPQQRA